MAKFVVNGGKKLCGDICVGGAKNAVLPILAACLMTYDEVTLSDCPDILDVDNMMSIMSFLGCEAKKENHTLTLNAHDASGYTMPQHLSKALRSSIFMLGPIIGRFRKACCVYPGGCEIGNRPIDLHLSGLARLNVDVREEGGCIICDGSDMRGAIVHLDYPSVGATENLMMAAVAAKGKTVILNAAREPEIIDLQNFLVKAGYNVCGAGTSTIEVVGGEPTGAKVSHSIMSDRIVAGTLLCAAAVTQGDVTLKNVVPDHMSSVISKLRETGCVIVTGNDFVSISAPGELKEIKHTETMPHPGFPTDMQAQLLAVCTVCGGTSVMVENVFENRFKHVHEFTRMGADITQKDRMAIVRGVKSLTGANVCAQDLRGGAALLIAGLCAKGRTVVEGVEHIDRGYESIENMLCALGADVTRIE